MTRRLIASLLALAVTSVHALPIVFFDTEFNTDAVALAQGVADAQSDASPTSPLPISSDAVASGSTDAATAGAFATPGLLIASSDATSATDLASSVASTHFNGSFMSGGPLQLSLGFDVMGFASEGASANASLFVTLLNSGITLIDDVFTVPEVLRFSFYVPRQSLSVLDITLASESFANPGSSASNLALLDISGTVPAPATWLLVVLALALMAALRSGHRLKDLMGPTRCL